MTTVEAIVAENEEQFVDFFPASEKVVVTDDMLTDDNIIRTVQRMRMDALLNPNFSSLGEEQLILMRDLVGTSLSSKKIKVEEDTNDAIGKAIIAQYIADRRGQKSLYREEGTGSSVASRTEGLEDLLPEIRVIDGQLDNHQHDLKYEPRTEE